MRTAYVMLIWLLFQPLVFALDVIVDRSSINYLSIKNGAVAEVGQFRDFSAHLSDSGQLKLEIDLSSVDSSIALRDQRMRDLLFEVARFPVATVKARLPLDRLLQLQAGEELTLEVNGRLHLHGIGQALVASIRVVGLADGALRATTVVPVLINLEDFALQDGLEELRSLASLSSIDAVTPVFFSLVFHR